MPAWGAGRWIPVWASWNTIIKRENYSWLIKVKEFKSLFLNCCMRTPVSNIPQGKSTKSKTLLKKKKKIPTFMELLWNFMVYIFLDLNNSNFFITIVMKWLSKSVIFQGVLFFLKTHPRGVRKLNSCSMDSCTEDVIYFSLKSKMEAVPSSD